MTHNLADSGGGGSTGGGGGSSGDGGDDGGWLEPVTDTVSGWGDLSLPDWLTDLKGVSDTLVTFAKDPRGFIIGIIITAFLNGLLGFVENVLAVVLQAWGLVAGIPGTILGALQGAGATVAASVFGAGGTVLGPVAGLVGALGWTAPLVFALILVALSEAADELGIPVASALSDALGAVPVVGSLLDAVLTLIIGVIRR